MGVPSPRTPVRIARGTKSVLTTNKAALEEGEICYATDENRCYVKEGSDLEDISTALINSDTFSGASTSNVNSATGTKNYIDTQVATKQASDADLTSLSSCQSGAAAALALLTSTEVEVLDGATVTTDELNKLDGFTGDKDDLIYAKDLKATGVTDTEFDYLDGVTSNIQTQLNAKGVGDAVLANDQNWTGAQRGAITALTDGATIAVDFNSSNNFSVTLAGNRTLGQPSNQVAGQSGSVFVTQDGTGSRTLAYHADWDFAGGTAPTLSTAANAVDRIDYIVAAANKIHAVATLDVK